MTTFAVSSAPSRTASRTAFLAIAAGNLLVVLDTTILNVAVPDVSASLRPSPAALPWAVDAYTVVFAGLLLVGGVLADRWGARRVYLWGLGAFAVLSALCAAAPGIGVLIAGRALLGAAGAGLVPASLALLVHLNPDPARRTRAVASWAVVSGVGASAGPLLGGALVELGGWRLVFLVNPPIALAVLLVARGLTAPSVQEARGLDLAGLLLSTAGLGLLTFGLVEAGIEGWTSVRALVALVASAAAFAALPFAERRTAFPVLPPALLALPKVRAAMAGAAVACFAYFGSLYLLAVWMQDAYALSPWRAGLVSLPMVLPVCFMPLVAGRLMARHGARPVLLTGVVLAAVGGVLLLFAGGAHPPLALLFAAELVLAGTGTLCITAAAAEMAAATPPAYAATGQGALNGVRQAGSALGVATLGTLTHLPSAGWILIPAGLLGTAVLLASRA
ncbi:MFS transporter [Actinocorallia aurea]